MCGLILLNLIEVQLIATSQEKLLLKEVFMSRLYFVHQIMTSGINKSIDKY